MLLQEILLHDPLPEEEYKDVHDVLIRKRLLPSFRTPEEGQSLYISAYEQARDIYNRSVHDVIERMEAWGRRHPELYEQARHMFCERAVFRYDLRTKAGSDMADYDVNMRLYARNI